MYHDTPPRLSGDYPDDDYTIELAAFGRHVALMKRLSGGEPMRQIVFTFDDGHAGNLHAARLLREMDMSGVFFVISARIGLEGYLCENDLREIRDLGHEIGSHSATHPIFTEISDDDCIREFVLSKARIERITGVPCTSFAFPGGAFFPRHVGLAKAAGYESVFSSIEGPRSPEGYFFRFHVRRSTSARVTDIASLKRSYALRRHARSQASLLAIRLKGAARQIRTRLS
jgi:peptidoglycan/xylan/chitin deacetylase (PgdA/CDA1 family)